MSNTKKDGCGGVATDSKTAGDLTKTDAALTSRNPLDPAEEYKMDHKRRGLALIFNQEHFHQELDLSSRHGTYADRCNLERRFNALNFEVQVSDNLMREEILAKISEASEEDHLHADCLVCIFLSHGEKDHVYAFDDKISIQDITALFKGDKCRSLVGKPKIFILQACRGDNSDVAASMVDSDAMGGQVTAGGQVTEGDQVTADAGVIHTLPAGADFLMCYSVAEGYFSFREKLHGSWYIQDLCEALENFGHSLEFTELLTLVNRTVSLREVEDSKDPKQIIVKKQVPCFASMLTKKLYFRRKP